MKSCILIANGDIPLKGIIKYLQKNSVETIIAADGGANSAYKLSIVPNYIIGDLDSIDPKVKEFYSDKSKIIHLRRQNDTDVEKALKFAIKNKFKTVYMLGGTGNRLDHSICNLGIILKYFSKIRIVLIHHNTILFPYSENTKLMTVPNETISLYAFDDNTFISSKGLKYSLQNSTLRFGKKESTSNVALADEVSLKISGGIIFVIRDFKLMRNNGLIFKS